MKINNKYLNVINKQNQKKNQTKFFLVEQITNVEPIVFRYAGPTLHIVSLQWVSKPVSRPDSTFWIPNMSLRIFFCTTNALQLMVGSLTHGCIFCRVRPCTNRRLALNEILHRLKVQSYRLVDLFDLRKCPCGLRHI